MKKFFDSRRELVSVGPGSGGGGGSSGVGGNFIGRTFIIGHHQVTVEETLAEGQDDHTGHTWTHGLVTVPPKYDQVHHQTQQVYVSEDTHSNKKLRKIQPCAVIKLLSVMVAWSITIKMFLISWHLEVFIYCSYMAAIWPWLQFVPLKVQWLCLCV